MSTPFAYFDKHPAPIRAVLYRLHALVENSANGISFRLAWGQPFYYYKGSWFCFISFVKKWNCVELGFTRGHLLDDPDGVLLNRNRKMIRSLSFQDLEDLKRQEEVVLEMIQRALMIQESNQN
ncbi:DUF1801 domain-containing protein [Arundinibacter roseus]|uniref:DUF1801 domain-containing protein n=1 Tax=Arundinibacter roseus TaxID=2070510 RepID=A0A4R4KCT7_9BACT|nr:DUF1801 domain-containing protein [Arundinibacter roseus]TDB64556.1 DUF1801 domain-containing protein [Arundinibacter roseus]